MSSSSANFKLKENNFGLSGEEILLADDRELDEYVSMKKLAPYRTAPIKVCVGRRLGNNMVHFCASYHSILPACSSTSFFSIVYIHILCV